MSATIGTPEPADDPGAPHGEKGIPPLAVEHPEHEVPAPGFAPHRINLPAAIEQALDDRLNPLVDADAVRDEILALVHGWYSETETDRRRREDDRTAADRLHPLVDDVWCLTCQHTHIPGIQTVTFRCHAPLPEGHATVPDGTSGCGFGVWSLTVAAEHADRYPDHIVHPVHHVTVPLTDMELWGGTTDPPAED